MTISYGTASKGYWTGYTIASNTGGRAIAFESKGVDLNNVPIIAVPKRDRGVEGKTQPGDIVILKSDYTGKFTVAVAADVGGLSSADGDLGRQTAANLGLNLTESGSSLTYAEGEKQGRGLDKNDLKHAVIVSTGTYNFPSLEKSGDITDSRTLRKFTSQESLSFVKDLNERINAGEVTELQAAQEVSKFYDDFRKSEKGQAAYESLARVTGKEFRDTELAYLENIPEYLKKPEAEKSDAPAVMENEAALMASVIDNKSRNSEGKSEDVYVFGKNNLNASELASFVESYNAVKKSVESGNIIDYGDRGEAARSLQIVMNSWDKANGSKEAPLKADSDFRTNSVAELKEMQTELGFTEGNGKDGRFGKGTLAALEQQLPQELQLAIKRSKEPAAQFAATTLPENTPAANPTIVANNSEPAKETVASR